jgi:hypothetical protein
VVSTQPCVLTHGMGKVGRATRCSRMHVTHPWEAGMLRTLAVLRCISEFCVDGS